MKAIVYARVSTARQAEDELPLDSQLDRCRQYAHELGAEVLQEFVDRGISAASDKRPAFLDAIEFCEAYQPDYLITWSTSRFARNKVDAGLYKRRLRKAGTQLTYVSQSIEADTDSGWLLESMLEIIDEQKSRETSADTRRSMIRNAQQGYWNGGKVPYGYRPEPHPTAPKRRHLATDPAEARVVEQMFRWRLDGFGTYEIAERLRDQGLTNRGVPWRSSSVLAVLRNEAMAGRIVFNRKDRRTNKNRPRDQWIIVDSHEPIIEPQTFAEVQRMISSDAPVYDTGSPHSTWVFTGFLRCGLCGGGMQIESAKGRSQRYYYYNCRNWQERKQCECRRIRADEFDPWLLDRIVADILNQENLRQLVRDLNEAAGVQAREIREKRRRLEKTIRELQQKNARLYDILELHGRDAPNLGDLTERLRQNNAQIKAAEQELYALDSAEVPDYEVSDQDIQEIGDVLAEVIKTTENVTKLRAFLGEFLKEVRVEREQVSVEYSPEALIAPPGERFLGTSGWLPDWGLLGTKVIAFSMPANRRRRWSGKAA